MEAASPSCSRKFSKKFKKPRASGAHLELIQMRCAQFLNPYRISLFPVSCHFKDQKEEIGIKWNKMMYHFLNKFRIYAAQKGRHLRNRSFERIYVQNWILEVRVQKKGSFERHTFEQNLRYSLPKKVHFLKKKLPCYSGKRRSPEIGAC